MSERRPKIKVRQVHADSPRQGWYWTVVDTNGEAIGGSHGEIYTRRADAVRGLHNFIASVAIADIEIDEPREGTEA